MSYPQQPLLGGYPPLPGDPSAPPPQAMPQPVPAPMPMPMPMPMPAANAQGIGFKPEVVTYPQIPVDHQPIVSSAAADTMGSTNGKIEPQEGEDEFDGPVRERTCTDTAWLFVKIVFVIGLFALVGHCMMNGDLYRLFNGYDACGNVCGRKNAKESDPKFCKGEDMTSKKYLLIKDGGKAIVDPKNINKECVANCNVYPGYEEILNRCVPTSSNSSGKDIVSWTGDFFHDVSEDLHLVWPQIVFLSLMAVAISIILLILFRYFAVFIVWFILLATVAFSIGSTIFLWVTYNKRSKIEKKSLNDQREANTYRDAAIVATIVSVIILLVILFMRKKIKLVAQLFKESSKAISAMPLIIGQPIVTFAAMAFTMTMWIYFSLWIQSSGVLTQIPDSTYFYYKKNIAMKTARWYNLFAMYWFIQFLIGCQHMIIAGAVATWYFSREKTKLRSPIGRSWKNLVRFHLGTVIFGSLLIAIVQMIKTLVNMTKRAMKDSENNYVKIAYNCLECCLDAVEDLLKYLSRNAYIEVAIFGSTFCEGGKQAVKHLFNNSISVFAINSVGDFVLFLSKVLVVLITGVTAIVIFDEKEGLQYMWLPVVIVCLFAYFVAHCFITVYEMVIDTIFLCFCEDCELNDGINKPYYMNKGLMEFVENSKKVLKVGEDYENSSPRK